MEKAITPFRRKVAVIAVVSFVLSMLIQVVSLIPVMLMPALIDIYIPAGEIARVVLCIMHSGSGDFRLQLVSVLFDASEP